MAGCDKTSDLIGRLMAAADCHPETAAVMCDAAAALAVFDLENGALQTIATQLYGWIATFDADPYPIDAYLVDPTVAEKKVALWLCPFLGDAEGESDARL